jgi:hypothetical protein
MLYGLDTLLEIYEFKSRNLSAVFINDFFPNCHFGKASKQLASQQTAPAPISKCNNVTWDAERLRYSGSLKIIVRNTDLVVTVYEVTGYVPDNVSSIPDSGRNIFATDSRPALSNGYTG